MYKDEESYLLDTLVLTDEITHTHKHTHLFKVTMLVNDTQKQEAYISNYLQRQVVLNEIIWWKFETLDKLRRKRGFTQFVRI